MPALTAIRFPNLGQVQAMSDSAKLLPDLEADVFRVEPPGNRDHGQQVRTRATETAEDEWLPPLATTGTPIGLIDPVRLAPTDLHVAARENVQKVDHLFVAGVIG